MILGVWKVEVEVEVEVLIGRLVSVESGELDIK